MTVPNPEQPAVAVHSDGSLSMLPVSQQVTTAQVTSTSLPSVVIGNVAAKLSAFKVLVLREPMLWLGLVAAVITFVSSQIFPLTVDQQGALNAVAVAIVGVLGAFSVSTDQGVPLLAGLGKALIALALSFGLHWAPEAQSSAIALLSVATSLWTRTQVTPPVPLATLKVLPQAHLDQAA